LAESGAIASPGPGRGAGGDRRSPVRRGPGTRDAIDSAALELFAQRGYHATSMRAIASAAEVQPAAIYHWYPGKEAILIGFQDGFMEELTAKVLDAVGRQRRPALRLAAAVWEHVVFHGIHSLAAFVTDSEIRALAPEPRRALIAKRDSYQEMFAAMIREGLQDGSLGVSEADVATYAILLQCTGVALWFDPAGPLSLERVADIHVELVLGSVGAEPRLVADAIGSVSRELSAEERV
jgi:AcrR family transcriptional regulator